MSESKRYEVQPEYEVIKPSYWGVRDTKRRNDIINFICVCWSEEEAQLICDALNEKEEDALNEKEERDNAKKY